jgi:hypothetical protein
MLREADQPHWTKSGACAARRGSHLGLSTDEFHPPDGLRSPSDAATNTLRGLRQRPSPHSVVRDLWTLRFHSFGRRQPVVSLQRVRLQRLHRGRDVGPSAQVLSPYRRARPEGSSAESKGSVLSPPARLPAPHMEASGIGDRQGTRKPTCCGSAGRNRGTASGIHAAGCIGGGRSRPDTAA